MYRFIESIRLENGNLQNLSCHQARVDQVFSDFFIDKPPINLSEFLSSCPMPSVGVHKVRVAYDSEVQSTKISLYKAKEINSLRVVKSDTISYSYKFEDRNELNNLLALREDSEEIIIVKNNMITDASFANLVLKKKDKWFTPSTYLLNGIMRQQLLEEKKIGEEEISINELKQYEKIKLINSMLQFDGAEIDVSRIVG
jgi:4-amino-4-deoxychorismate lyase